MEKAKRARKAETPKRPSLSLRLRAPYLYPDRGYSAKSSTQPDGGEGLAKRKGVTARWGPKTAWSKAAARWTIHWITRPTRPDERANDREVHGHQGSGW